MARKIKKALYQKIASKWPGPRSTVADRESAALDCGVSAKTVARVWDLCDELDQGKDLLDVRGKPAPGEYRAAVVGGLAARIIRDVFKEMDQEDELTRKVHRLRPK